jgi:site-specific DNA-methyltransferase (adenine-specific)
LNRELLCQIEVADALTLMRTLPDRSIDCIITDPPYGTTALKWDRSIDWAEFWREAKRISKPSTIHALFAQQPFATDLINSNRQAFRYEIIWEKTLALGFLDCNKRPMRTHELMLVFCEGLWKTSTYNPQKTPGKPYEKRSGKQGGQVYGQHSSVTTDNTGDRFPRDVLKFSNRSAKSLHPTQKPIDLLQWLVATYSNPGDLILDPFLGSGTTAIACQELGRHFIGGDSNPDYVAIARDRVAQTAPSLSYA